MTDTQTRDIAYFAPVRYDTIRWTILTCAQKLTSSQLNLPHGPEQKRVMKKTEMLRRKGPVFKVHGVSTEAGRSLYGGWERFVKEIGLEPGVKEKWSYGW